MNKPAQFTPGPWHVSTTHIGEIAVADSRGINLCVLGDASLFDTITPDAAIIAAAPAMYEALRQSLVLVELAALEEWGRAVRGEQQPPTTEARDREKFVKQAIAQAEGR